MTKMLHMKIFHFDLCRAGIQEFCAKQNGSGSILLVLLQCYDDILQQMWNSGVFDLFLMAYCRENVHVGCMYS
jgi:hypothetical protein